MNIAEVDSAINDYGAENFESIKFFGEAIDKAIAALGGLESLESRIGWYNDQIAGETDADKRQELTQTRDNLQSMLYSYELLRNGAGLSGEYRDWMLYRNYGDPFAMRAETAQAEHNLPRLQANLDSILREIEYLESGRTRIRSGVDLTQESAALPDLYKQRDELIAQIAAASEALGMTAGSTINESGYGGTGGEFYEAKGTGWDALKSFFGGLFGGSAQA